ncbi:hypothetical protein R6Z07F_005141 [Ovis aries]
MVVSPCRRRAPGFRERGEGGGRRRGVAPAGSAASPSPSAWVRGEARLPPRHLARGVPFRAMLLRPSPPLPASRSAEPPGSPPARPTPPPRRAKSLEISTAAGTASPPRASPPGLPGPPLPTPPAEEKNSLSSVNSAARRSLPRRPGLRRHTPGDWWKSRHRIKHEVCRDKEIPQPANGVAFVIRRSQFKAIASAAQAHFGYHVPQIYSDC